MKILMHVNELSYGGVQVIAVTRLADFIKLGHEVLLTYCDDGPMHKILDDNKISCMQVSDTTDLIITITQFSPNVIHGHTCVQGTIISPLVPYLKKRISFIYGETIHSIGKNFGKDDFNVVHTHVAHDLNLQATFIPWGMDTERLTPTIGYDEYRDKWKIPKGTLVIGRNSRLDGSKLPYKFLDTLEILRGQEHKENFKICGVLGGEGPERERLEEHAKRIGISSRVIFTGGDYNVGNILSGVDIIVYPTNDESFCAGVVEPMYMRKPIVCYERGGMGQHVIHNVTAFVGNSPNLLASGVVYLASNSNERKRLTDNAYDQCNYMGYWDRMKDSIAHIEMYEKAISGR